MQRRKGILWPRAVLSGGSQKQLKCRIWIRSKRIPNRVPCGDTSFIALPTSRYVGSFANFSVYATQSQSNMPWHFNRKANSIAVSFSLSNRPDCEKWPAPRSHLKSSMRLSVLCSLSLATNLAGSLHDTPTLATHVVERRMSRIPISDDQ